MKRLSILGLMLLALNNESMGQVLTDSRENWNPRGKMFSVACKKEDGSLFFIENKKMVDVRVNFVDMEISPEVTETMDISMCIAEQKSKEKVAREEMLYAVYSVDCDLPGFELRKHDFRILGYNQKIAWVKRLTDGSVWGLSRQICKFKKKLPPLSYLTLNDRNKQMKEDTVKQPVSVPNKN